MTTSLVCDKKHDGKTANNKKIKFQYIKSDSLFTRYNSKSMSLL